jgi:hypothetical protein
MVVVRLQDRAPLQRMLRHRFKYARGVVQWMVFNEWGNRNFAFEDQFQSGGILFWRAPPVSTRSGIEGHQVGEPQFDGLRSETYHGQVSSMIQ